MTRPNILFILADDMGYGDFGCFNGGLSQTPALDQMVAEGVCLTQHYSASPVCAPARASLLTGRYPHRTAQRRARRALPSPAARLRRVRRLPLRWPAGLASPRTLPQMIHFTDWLPTLLAVAGSAPPATLRLDGVDALPVLQGESDRVPAQRFWQWNRYAPAAECNAAMRDGNWKLVRPAIGTLMAVSPDDFAMDVDAKYHPEKYPDILRDLPPPPLASSAVPSQLFDLDIDPAERDDLAAAHPDRVARMERALSRWFEDVERDRRAIPPA